MKNKKHIERCRDCNEPMRFVPDIGNEYLAISWSISGAVTSPGGFFVCDDWKLMTRGYVPNE